MVSTYYRGALNISNMRLFDNEVDAKAYIASVLQQEYKTQNIYTDGEKIYYTLYNESINRYYFEAVGYNFEDEAERSMKGL